MNEKSFLEEDGLEGVTAPELLDEAPKERDEGDLRNDAVSTASGPNNSVLSSALKVL